LRICMASRVLVAVIVAVMAVAGAGAATVYFLKQPAKSPAGTHGPPANNTNATNSTSEVLITDGNNRMTLSIPLVGTSFVSTDIKDHFTLPPDVGKVTVNMSWDRSGWDLSLAMGVGDCPDNGTVKASAQNVNAGPLTLEFKGGCGGCPEGQWFVHAACNEAGSHRGETVTFSYTVTVKCCG